MPPTVDMSSAIDAVIFDFGGVILNLDYPATDKALRALLGSSGVVRYTKTFQSEIFDALEIGAIDADAFYKALRDASGKDLSDAEIDAAWNAMLLDVPPERFEFLKAVAARYRTFLFSNTNAIHKKAFDATLERHLGQGGFDRIFEKAYYSHTFGRRKPHVETYKALVDDIGVPAARCLFIDDNADNIRGAREAGLQVIHLTEDLLQDPRLLALLK